MQAPDEQNCPDGQPQVSIAPVQLFMTLVPHACPLQALSTQQVPRSVAR